MDRAFGPIDPGAAEHAPLSARRGKIDAKFVEKIQAFGRDLAALLAEYDVIGVWGVILLAALTICTVVTAVWLWRKI
jgi:hypothetical protein